MVLSQLYDLRHFQKNMKKKSFSTHASTVFCYFMNKLEFNLIAFRGYRIPSIQGRSSHVHQSPSLQLQTASNHSESSGSKSVMDFTGKYQCKARSSYLPTKFSYQGGRCY
ncbi:hypothetical protein PMIN02_000748 [Paraphaeosphaeria minitans]